MSIFKASVITVITVTLLMLSECSSNKKQESKGNDILPNNIVLSSKVVKVSDGEDFKSDSEYNVVDVIKEEDSLVIVANAEISDEKEAYHLGRFISNNVKIGNREQLLKDKVNNINVFFNGLSRDFYFDGSKEIREINQNWGELSAK